MYIQRAIDKIRGKLQVGVKVNVGKMDTLKFADYIVIVTENEHYLQ